MIDPRWLAGFFDGEGSIGITVAGKYRRCILRLTLVNTDYDLLAAIQGEYLKSRMHLLNKKGRAA